MPRYSDQAGRGPSSLKLRIRGVIVAALLGVVVLVLQQLATGKYDDTFALTVVADTIGEGLAPGAEVKFHGLAIGSVKTLQSIGYNKQKMTVLLDPRQAKALTADTKAKFSSSNVFGSAVVELVSDGKGGPLRANQTLVMPAGTEAVSITGMLRQTQKLSEILDAPQFNHIVKILGQRTDLVEPVVRSAFDLAKILADAQTVPFSQSLSMVASIANGANEFIPLFGLMNNLLDGLAFLAQPAGVDRTNRVLNETGGLLIDAGQLIVDNNYWLIPAVAATLNLAIPLTFFVGSWFPAYDRLPGLFDRISTAFPVIDGQVQMRTEVIMNTMPGLAAALPSEPAAAPPGGGQ
ncbi:MlaD family protein [Mycobacterium kyorinense]|uniref:Mammalian cell entry protein n=1 Tax=Mycobacterium kyorinense TaxID=487514 RepID=A0A1X1XGW4_9MYCO|nr:MlaD family protein [Mycobacterium kyorinense]ORV97968.1 mammalian cell entry protein [Mycobacterium kyorinense]